jgi:hypothetical protein
MANRFARRIREGRIASIADLKAEFKELAKVTHPDAVGPGADHGDFAELRAEYESALRDFAKHRFGARRADGGPARAAGGAAPSGEGLAREALPREAWACLALLLGRGFPKSPRHEKERSRYEYARWRFAEALGAERGQLFEDFEAELLGMRESRSTALRPTLGLLGLLIEFSETGLSAMRTEIVLAFSALRRDPRIGPGCSAFLAALAGELGIGGEIGPSGRAASDE